MKLKTNQEHPRKLFVRCFQEHLSHPYKFYTNLKHQQIERQQVLTSFTKHVYIVYMNIYIYIYIYIHICIAGCGGESFENQSGKSFRFVRTCERARRGEAAWASERRFDPIARAVWGKFCWGRHVVAAKPCRLSGCPRLSVCPVCIAM